MMAAREIASALGGKRMGDGGYLCRCPGPLHRHGDRNPSLSVKDGRNRLLFHCFAGCTYDEIVSAPRARGLRA
jgi:putative DNA primase/helicase